MGAMIRSLMFISSLTLFAGAAHAEKQELVSLKCFGANGLILDLKKNAEIVKTKLGLFEQDFSTSREVSILRKGKQAITRITLSDEKDVKNLIYDIYLGNVPKKGKTEKILGLVGNSVLNVLVFPSYPAPINTPVGFLPVTTLSCEVLTK